MKMEPFADEDTAEVLAKEFLPEPLSAHWLVFPKRLFQWQTANIMILGAAIGSLLTAIAADFVPVDNLMWGFVILFAAAHVIGRFVIGPKDNAAIAEARTAVNSATIKD